MAFLSRLFCHRFLPLFSLMFFVKIIFLVKMVFHTCNIPTVHIPGQAFHNREMLYMLDGFICFINSIIIIVTDLCDY